MSVDYHMHCIRDEVQVGAVTPRGDLAPIGADVAPAESELNAQPALLLAAVLSSTAPNSAGIGRALLQHSSWHPTQDALNAVPA